MKNLRYKHLCPTETEIRHALHLQTIAKFKPKDIVFPKEDNWHPKTQLDKIIYKILKNEQI